MRTREALVLLGTLSTTILAAESSRPRGVGPDFAKFYKDSEKFTCISNPSISIDVSQLNDDYCDCPDGSDEPGTAACTFISSLSPAQPLVPSQANSTAALPGFYCKNKGHRPSYVPFTYVNDGVCDFELCCDGSDEWAGVGGTKCEDKCKEIGKEWKRKEDLRLKSQAKALKKKEELVREAQALKAQVQTQITNQEAEIKELEAKEKVLKEKFEEVEKRERGRVVSSTGAKGSKVTILAGLAKRRVEELREALVGVVGKRDELKEKVQQLEGILAAFKEEYNPNFNDEGVKRAVKSWEDYAAKKTGSEDNEAEERDLEDISKPDSDSEGINWTEWESTEEESDVDSLYKFEEYLPEFAREWVHEKLTDLRQLLIKNGILADNVSSGPESRAVANARSAYQAVSDDLGIKQTSLGKLTQDLTKEYGTDDIFRALKGSCITKDTGDYEYELCWLDNTSQKSKKGGGNTGMGNFVRFGSETVDEETRADGRGLGRGERVTLVYENGQRCWNGPNRQTTVVLGCAEQGELWKVIEQEKCSYRMEVGTPAVCVKEGEGKKEKPKEKGKDEL